MYNPECMDQLASDFFREFSRFEYCLKRVGLVKNSGRPEANWKAFANDIDQYLEAPSTEKLEKAIEYLLKFPPKKQVFNHNRELAWSETLPDHESKAELVLLLICRIRNNLFHGGKFNGQWFDPERSEELITNSLIILKTCRENHEDVNSAYEQKAF